MILYDRRVAVAVKPPLPHVTLDDPDDRVQIVQLSTVKRPA